MGSGFECPPDHPHGESQACRHHGCTCDPCRLAHNARGRNRRKQIAYGRSTTVDATPAREHIAALRAQGMGVKVIAQLCGVSMPTIGAVMWGRDGRDAPSWIHRRTADKILGVEFNLDHLLPAAMVDITPSRRRLQALACLGWTWKAIGEECGMGYNPVGLIAASNKRVKVEAATARTIRDVYERLWDTAPIPRDAHQASRFELAKRRAKTSGWMPPLAWYDIDNLDENPGEVTPDEPGWVVDELDHLYGLGESPEQAATALRSTGPTLAKLARRHGRPDLARWVGDKTKDAA